MNSDFFFLTDPQLQRHNCWSKQTPTFSVASFFNTDGIHGIGKVSVVSETAEILETLETQKFLKVLGIQEVLGSQEMLKVLDVE